MKTPKQQLIANRKGIMEDTTVEKALKYPVMFTSLFEQADTMYKYEWVMELNKYED